MQKYKILLLIFLGSLTWGLTMWKSGQVYGFGRGFWGPHGHDAVWHLSLINSMASNQLTLPMYSGEILKNYHFGFDAMTAVLVKLTGVSASIYYFQILPIIFSITIGFLVYYLTRNTWSVYLTYFATGFGWIVTLFRGQGLGGESLFWSQQAISTLINPPFALSLIFLLLGFIFLRKSSYLLASIFFGTVGFIKVYAGILGIFTLLFFAPAVYTTISILLFLTLFLPFNSILNQTLVFRPLWFIRTMLENTDRFYWPKLSSAVTNYYLSGNLIKLLPSSILALLIFLFGNLGIRLVGLFKIDKLFFPMVIFGLVFPILFVQSGTTWNTIQFMYYSMFFLNLFIKPKTLLYAICIVLLTLPAVPATLRHYLPPRPPTAIPQSEIRTLQFLESQPSGVVLVPLFDKSNFQKFSEPRPLFSYESTAYVSAYSQKSVFLEDEVNLKILNLDISNRQRIVSEIFNSQDSAYVTSLIIHNQIQYLYLPNVDIIKPKLSPSEFGLKNVFSTGSTQLWSR